MTVNPLEKVARAIFQSHVGFAHQYDANPVRKAHWEKTALAALEALKNPGAEMFAEIGYRGLNRTRDTATAAEAAFNYGLCYILSQLSSEQGRVVEP